MRGLILALFLAIASIASAAPSADDLAARLNRRLDQRPVLRAEFVQEKQMAAFKKPLVTRGRLVFVRGEGILWKIEAPIKLTYVLTDDRIVEIGEGGGIQARTTAEMPGIAQVGRVFRALLGAQTATLAENFTVAPEGTPEAWRLALTPKSGPLAQFMKRIQLAGGRHVDRIRIEEANGDAMAISFRNTAEDDAPTPEERAQFGVHR